MLKPLFSSTGNMVALQCHGLPQHCIWMVHALRQLGAIRRQDQYWEKGNEAGLLKVVWRMKLNRLG